VAIAIVLGALSGKSLFKRETNGRGWRH
jgi:hypothetical protein